MTILLDWALSIPGKSTVLLAAGLVAVWIARRAKASVRHLFLAVTFASLVALPAGIALIPRVSVTLPVAADRPASVPSPPGIGRRPHDPAPWRRVVAIPAGLDHRPHLVDRWGGPAAVGLARDLWQLRRLRRHGLPARDLSDLVIRSPRNEASVAISRSCCMREFPRSTHLRVVASRDSPSARRARMERGGPASRHRTRVRALCAGAIGRYNWPSARCRRAIGSIRWCG